ncbi:MAG: 3-hydroxyacyl-CoA dehydrogenase family protein [Bacteroidetes bacterium]|jgi:3-hydroxybutyryl-CoA dehydrogenase|nr:3-hydroxyacyl-CoA dehydrogenase family protein [Bacteroidota bacterium]MBT3750322.1 3-hydroxyacyl-CoA dehydrogenase family protein [Bacteroidota bacterium]MBT4400359.1 3-hydroxyacyl-CoA dehydrogenase family protein [Bacteroidota bacterium]MBT4411305.1 3-hydroxyacyl-CoA dehydrogenase family protein [Bacteroidota bacterium]MBT7092572.1 3-hydroxyacyl-CoA dehydrogenase family protein [Bacteroidota bacterium]
MSEIVEAIEQYGLSDKNRPKAQFGKIGIVGCGSVGQTIARIISTSGMDVIFIELSDERVEAAIKGIEQTLDDMINHWGMTEGEKRSILSRIHGYVSCSALSGADLVIEAIKSKIREQRVSQRKELFKKIESQVSPDTIIATNSTTVVITELSSELIHKDRCVSLHFSTSNPGANIVEAVKGLYTSDQVYANVQKFIKMIGRKMVPVEESPGLLSVRLFATLINEASDILMESVGSMEDIDMAARVSLGFPLGPFELADKIGLDKVVRWLDNLYNEFGDMKYKASPILRKKVRASQNGRSVGKGFYEYKDGRKITTKTY